jgi:SAM-dependent methyltransferase
MYWKAYNDLAWTDHILASPEEYEKEVMLFSNAIKQHTASAPRTMLHLGCGAGGHDFYFKKFFDLTGVDISEGMLEIATQLNPEVNYLRGDMRSLDLGQKYDVVIIPESIMYMTSPGDLEKAFSTAVGHLQPQGVLLVVTHTQEEYADNNFAYSGHSDGIHVIDENHYEATLVYLIRQDGKLEIESEVHTLGIFSRQTWLDLFSRHGLIVSEARLDHQYDQYLLDDGEYKLTTFIGVKSA